MKEFSRFVKRLEALGATEPGSHEVTRALDGHAYAELRSSIDITSRRASGAFFTGPFIAKRIPNLDSSPNIVLDPACGAGKPPTAALEFDFAAAEAEVERGGGFDPTSITDARRKVLASIVRRQGQTKFRNELMEAYEGRCAISNCAIPELLEAAHIHPYKGAETNDVRNGILLRTDLHTLFDLGLLAIDTGSWAVLISPRLLGSNYEQFSRRKLRRPRDEAQHPSVEALIQRRTEAGL